MKRRLAKAVMLSLICANVVVCDVEAAQEFIITDTALNEVVINGPGFVDIKDNSTSPQTGYNSDSNSSIKKFTIDNTINSNKVTINLIKRNDRYSVNSYAALENKADTVVNGVLTIHTDAINQKAIDNSGTIKFNDEVRFNSQIYNSNSGKFVSESYLHGMTLYSDINHTTVESFGNIINEGEMQINGRYKLEAAAPTGSWTAEDIIVIDNKGNLKLESDSQEESYVDGTIRNTGTMNMTLNKNDSFYGYILNDSGDFELNNNEGESLLFGITNNGELTIISESVSRDGLSIYGEVIHKQGAKTYIKLGNDEIQNDNFDCLQGTITGSNFGGFKLVLEKNGELWTMDGEHGSRQNEPISGVELNGGKIAFSDNYFLPADGATYWFNRYNVLTLNDFDSNGKFGSTTFDNHNDLVSGGIYLFTDLKNRVGDKVIFTGTTPDTIVPLGIYNKNDNNGTPIVREDGYRVTIVEAPSDTKMQFKTNLVIYGTPSQEFIDNNGGNSIGNSIEEVIDCCNSKVYKAQIDEIIEGNIKYWNFVGWEEAEDNRTGKQESQKEAIEHSILVEDVEPIFKRFNDLRTDPSEIGVWVRGETGETKIRNLSYDHNIMSGGYDWDYKNDAGVLFAGVGFTYSTNECDDKAIGDTKGYGFNAYGSWLGKKNNDYVDLVVKYGKLDKSYAGYDENNIFVAGEYDKDLFTIAAKYGRRIFKDDWYYEPSVGLTWGRVGSADFTDNHGTRIHADNSYSNIASLGIQVGKNIKGIEYYGKAEVMHDFDGKIHVSAPGRSVEDDMGGTWVKCAIGASRKIDENNSFYLEVERDFGNKVEKPYGFSAGYRFTW